MNRPPSLSKRMSDRVGRRIGVAGRGRDADHGVDGRVLVDLVGRSVDVRHRTDVEFVDIVDVDRHQLAVLKLPSLLVARTVMSWLAADSRSSNVPSATVTTPVYRRSRTVHPRCRPACK